MAASTTDEEVNGVLKLFPGYHLLTLQERDPGVRTFFVRHFPKDDPSVIQGDFNRDGVQDFALLLRDNKSPTTKLIVLLCSTQHECRRVYDLDETMYANAVYLRPANVGSKQSETAAVSGNRASAKLHSTGIQVTYFEKGKIVLYWNSKLKKIEEIQTED